MGQNCGVSGCFNGVVKESSFCWLHQPAKALNKDTLDQMTGGPTLRYRCKCGAEYPSYDECLDNHICPLLNKNAPVGSTFDPVNHPSHYNQGKFEVLDVIEDNLKEGFEAYLVGNILKYVMRYKHKNGIQDLEKAQFYLKRLIQKKGEENGNETK